MNLPNEDAFSTSLEAIKVLTETNDRTLALIFLAQLYIPAAPALRELESALIQLQKHHDQMAGLTLHLVDLRWFLQRLLLSIIKTVEPDQSRIARIKAVI